MNPENRLIDQEDFSTICLTNEQFYNLLHI